MNRGLLIAATLAALASGCASAPTQRAANVADADDQMVSDCNYLGEVHARAYIAIAGTGDRPVQIAKARAREKAQAMGATAIVWQQVNDGFGPILVRGRAYRCKN
jgi:hypothetical protein